VARDDLPDLAKRLITRAALAIAVVGAIDEARAAKLVDQVFADLPAADGRAAIAPAPFVGLGGVEVVDLDVPQTTIRFGRPALAREDDDYMASAVLVHVLGGGTGLSSRLFREVREKRGLAYSVSATISTSDHASYLYGGTTTKNERAYESLEVIRGEILDLARGGIDEDELEKGKRYLIGSYPLRFDTSTKIAGQLVQIQLEGHGPSWLTERNARISAVTLADARRVAERVFGDGSLSVVMVGRPSNA
jgi:zinc protease